MNVLALACIVFLSRICNSAASRDGRSPGPSASKVDYSLFNAQVSTVDGVSVLNCTAKPKTNASYFCYGDEIIWEGEGTDVCKSAIIHFDKDKPSAATLTCKGDNGTFNVYLYKDDQSWLQGKGNYNKRISTLVAKVNVPSDKRPTKPSSRKNSTTKNAPKVKNGRSRPGDNDHIEKLDQLSDSEDDDDNNDEKDDEEVTVKISPKRSSTKPLVSKKGSNNRDDDFDYEEEEPPNRPSKRSKRESGPKRTPPPTRKSPPTVPDDDDDEDDDDQNGQEEDGERENVEDDEQSDEENEEDNDEEDDQRTNDGVSIDYEENDQEDVRDGDDDMENDDDEDDNQNVTDGEDDEDDEDNDDDEEKYEEDEPDDTTQKNKRGKQGTSSPKAKVSKNSTTSKGLSSKVDTRLFNVKESEQNGIKILHCQSKGYISKFVCNSETIWRGSEKYSRIIAKVYFYEDEPKIVFLKVKVNEVLSKFFLHKDDDEWKDDKDGCIRELELMKKGYEETTVNDEDEEEDDDISNASEDEVEEVDVEVEEEDEEYELDEHSEPDVVEGKAIYINSGPVDILETGNRDLNEDIMYDSDVEEDLDEQDVENCRETTNYKNKAKRAQKPKSRHNAVHTNRIDKPQDAKNAPRRKKASTSASSDDQTSTESPSPRKSRVTSTSKNITLDVNAVDEELFTIEDSEEENVPLTTFTPMDGHKLTGVVYGEERLWNAGDKEYGKSVLVYYDNEDNPVSIILNYMRDDDNVGSRSYNKKSGKWKWVKKADNDKLLDDLKKGVMNKQTRENVSNKKVPRSREMPSAEDSEGLEDSEVTQEHPRKLDPKDHVANKIVWNDISYTPQRRTRAKRRYKMDYPRAKFDRALEYSRAKFDRVIEEATDSNDLTESHSPLEETVTSPPDVEEMTMSQSPSEGTMTDHSLLEEIMTDNSHVEEVISQPPSEATLTDSSALEEPVTEYPYPENRSTSKFEGGNGSGYEFSEWNTPENRCTLVNGMEKTITALFFPTYPSDRMINISKYNSTFYNIHDYYFDDVITRLIIPDLTVNITRLVYHREVIWIGADKEALVYATIHLEDVKPVLAYVVKNSDGKDKAETLVKSASGWRVVDDYIVAFKKLYRPIVIISDFAMDITRSDHTKYKVFDTVLDGLRTRFFIPGLGLRANKIYNDGVLIWTPESKPMEAGWRVILVRVYLKNDSCSLIKMILRTQNGSFSYIRYANLNGKWTEVDERTYEMNRLALKAYLVT